MRAANNWAIACLFAGAIAFAAPSYAQTAGGGQAGGSGQTGGTGQTGSTGGGQTGTGTEVGGRQTGMGAGSQSGKQGDQQFIQKAAISNLAQVQLGQLAQQNAQDPQVKQFAQTMIDQYTQAQNQLQQVASANGVTLPSSLDKKHQRVHDKLSKLQGADFDRQYMKAMVQAHQDTEKLLQKQANRNFASSATGQATGTVGTTGTQASGSGAAGTSGQVTSVDQYASTTLPQVQQHLQMARQLESNVKNEKKGNKGGK